jgi:hypothetical protein
MTHLRRIVTVALLLVAVAPILAHAGIGDYQTLSSSVSALPAGAASGWAVVPGAVQDASGMTAVIRADGGTMVTVDLSQLDADARTWVTPGRGVTVVGVYRTDGVLTARGVATSTP